MMAIVKEGSTGKHKKAVQHAGSEIVEAWCPGMEEYL
jgi:hypothetical protein